MAGRNGRWVGQVLAASLLVMLAPTPFDRGLLGAQAASPEALKLYSQAVSQERSGDLSGAVALLRSALLLEPNDVLNLTKLANLLFQQGNSAEARQLYRQAVVFSPNDGMIEFSLGAIEEQEGAYQKAEEAYLRGLHKNPDYAYGLLALGRVTAQQGRIEEAIARYRAFLQAYPTHFDGRRHLAHLLMVNQQPDLAVVEYETLKASYPSRFEDFLDLAKSLNRSNAPEKALETLKLAYAKEGDRSDIAVEMGNAHAALGQTHYAIQNYQRAQALNPEDASLALKLGELFQTTGNPGQAAQQFEAYLLKEPANGQVRQALANAYMESKQYPKAIETLSVLLAPGNTEMPPDTVYQLSKTLAFAHQQNGDTVRAIALYKGLSATEIGQGDAQLWENLAIAYRANRQLEESIGAYKQVLAIAPTTNPTMADQLATALTEKADGYFVAKDYANALLTYQEAAKYALPENTAPFMGLGKVHVAQRYSEKDSFDYAYQIFSDILKRQPDNEAAMVQLARLDLERGDADKVQQRLAPLAAAHTQEPEVYVLLADVYRAKGENTQAIETYTTALQFQPGNDRLILELGNLWRALGDNAKATEAYEKAKAVNPDNAMAWYNLGILYGEGPKLEASEGAYRKAMALAPQFADAEYGLATTLEKQNRLEEAATAYAQYITRRGASYVQAAQERLTVLKAGNPTQVKGQPMTVLPETEPAKIPARSESMKEVVKDPEALPPVMPSIQAKPAQEAQSGEVVKPLPATTPPPASRPPAVGPQPESQPQPVSGQPVRSAPEIPTQETTEPLSALTVEERSGGSPSYEAQTNTLPPLPELLPMEAIPETPAVTPTSDAFERLNFEEL